MKLKGGKQIIVDRNNTALWQAFLQTDVAQRQYLLYLHDVRAQRIYHQLFPDTCAYPLEVTLEQAHCYYRRRIHELWKIFIKDRERET